MVVVGARMLCRSREDSAAHVVGCAIEMLFSVVHVTGCAIESSISVAHRDGAPQKYDFL